MNSAGRGSEGRASPAELASALSPPPVIRGLSPPLDPTAPDPSDAPTPDPGRAVAPLAAAEPVRAPALDLVVSRGAPTSGPSRPDDFVRLAGRIFPRATGAERLAWCVLLMGVVLVLGLAAWLTPDPRGMGTHEQIPFFGGHMKPCGFAYATGIPCPSCGFTTTFALAAHGQIVAAVVNQPFGFVVFLVACALVPASLAAAIGSVSWSRVSDEWPWKRIMLVTVTCWLLAWAYKIAMVSR